MMIVRINRKNHHCAIIDVRCLENPDLSWRAKGILAYCMTFPKTTRLTAGLIVANGREGRDSVTAAMQELSEHGYAELTATRKKNGQIIGKEWTIYEAPEMRPTP